MITNITNIEYLSVRNADFVSEHAYQCYLMGRVTDAARLFEEATRLNETNLDALYGAIRCKIALGTLNIIIH